MHRPIVGITQGDALGIGPEIIRKSLEKRVTHFICRPIIIGDATVLKLPKKLSHIPIVAAQHSNYNNSALPSPRPRRNRATARRPHRPDRRT